jgi:hypothetical protein
MTRLLNLEAQWRSRRRTWAYESHLNFFQTSAARFDLCSSEGLPACRAHPPSPEGRGSAFVT